MNPLVSIIIPTYNRAHLIGETLDSILAQTYTNWECIIVDDGSTDNTIEVIKNYLEKDSRFQFYARPKNRPKGPNSCRNYGFEVSKGEYVNWFDSDDLYKNDTLKIFIENINETVDVVVGRLEKINSETGKKIVENTILSERLLEDYFVGNVTFYVCGPLWKRTFLEKKSDLFDEEIRYLDDWDFNLRMLYKNPKINFVNYSIIKYRIHPESLSQQIYRLNIEEIQSEFRAREKHLNLLKENKKININLAKTFVKDRYKYVLRDCLSRNCKCNLGLEKELLLKQLSLLDFVGLINTILGLISYKLFNKGYVFFK